jgi:hypothetical protein
MKSEPPTTTSIRSSPATITLIEKFRHARIKQITGDVLLANELVMLPKATYDQLLQQALATLLVLMDQQARGSKRKEAQGHA